MMNRKLRMGMVGGGSDAFIGAIHRLAAFMDGQIELVCGCFSINPEISLSSGKSYYLPENRVYKTYQEMFENEVKLPEGDRMDFVTIVTPNFAHFGPAMMALENGFNVVIDKPITFTLDEALQLQAKLQETGLLLALTHTYSGYPAVKQARQMVAEGQLGKIRKVLVEYPQGWLSAKVEDAGNAQASWLRFRGHLENISQNLLMGATNRFNDKTNSTLNQLLGIYAPVSEVAKYYKDKGISSIVVAEENYGEGSSREHAAMEPRFLNVKVVLAKSFARIHETNLKKQGILALTFIDKSDYDKVREDDKISVIGLSGFVSGSLLTVVLHHKDASSDQFKVRHTYSTQQIEWFKAGSALNIKK